MDSVIAKAQELIANPLIRSVAIMLGSVIVAWVSEFLIVRFLAAAARKTSTDLDDQLVQALRRPIFISVLFVGLSWAVDTLALPVEATFVLDGILKTGAIFVWTGVAFFVAKMVLEGVSNHSSERSILQTRTLPLFQMLFKGAIFGLSIYFFFLAWDVDVTAWLASAGIIGLAVGFAAQDTLSNLFAGIFIIADAPYRVDDFILLDNGVRGKVTRIGIRSTRVLTTDDVEVTIPNSVIGSAMIINEAGGPTQMQRVSVAVDAAYGADVDKVRRVLLGCAEGVPGIAVKPAPITRFCKFGGSGLGFQLMVWIESAEMRDQILDVLHEKVYKGFNAAKLEIPFSKHDLYLKEMPAKPFESRMSPE